MSHVTRDLLLTDVVDSTKLSQALGDVRLAQVWAAQGRLACDLRAPHQGLEIDKTDAFLFLFDNAVGRGSLRRGLKAGGRHRLS